MAAFSNSGKTFAISTTVQNADLDDHAVTGFPGLNYTLVNGVGSVGETGLATNIISYDTLDEDVTQKAKGLTNAGDPEIECRRIAADPGQIAMRAAGAVTNKDNYAFRIVDQDGTIHYNRGLVTGPRRPGGRNEDFELEVYSLGLNQVELVVNPTP
jgi:hypothetical protein